jgi:hypothetical protein
MFRSATDHHQGVHLFLVKITELKCDSSYVVMWQHNIFFLYVVSSVVRHALEKNGKEHVCIFLFAVTFHDVAACFSHESFVYQILWSSGFQLAPSHVRGPGFKFQYGAWLS